MIRRNAAVLALLSVLMMATGCSGGSEPKTTKPPVPNAKYADAPALSKALQATHVGCTGYAEDAKHPDAQSQGHCQVRGVSVTVAVYASEMEMMDQVARLQRTLPKAKSSDQWLVMGRNWTVNCGIYKAIAYVIRDRLRGTVIPVEQSSSARQ